MSNEIRNGDLLGLARVQARRRLKSLANIAVKFEPEQLTLLNSLLDEFARKSSIIRAQENNND